MKVNCDKCKDFLSKLWRSDRLTESSGLEFFQDNDLDEQGHLDKLYNARLIQLVKGKQMEYGETYFVLTPSGRRFVAEIQFADAKYRW